MRTQGAVLVEVKKGKDLTLGNDRFTKEHGLGIYELKIYIIYPTTFMYFD